MRAIVKQTYDRLRTDATVELHLIPLTCNKVTDRIQEALG